MHNIATKLSLVGCIGNYTVKISGGHSRFCGGPLATALISRYSLLLCGAVRSTILATIWLLVLPYCRHAAVQ